MKKDQLLSIWLLLGSTTFEGEQKACANRLEYYAKKHKIRLSQHLPQVKGTKFDFDYRVFAGKRQQNQYDFNREYNFDKIQEALREVGINARSAGESLKDIFGRMNKAGMFDFDGPPGGRTTNFSGKTNFHQYYRTHQEEFDRHFKNAWAEEEEDDIKKTAHKWRDFFKNVNDINITWLYKKFGYDDESEIDFVTRWRRTFPGDPNMWKDLYGFSKRDASRTARVLHPRECSFMYFHKNFTNTIIFEINIPRKWTKTTLRYHLLRLVRENAGESVNLKAYNYRINYAFKKAQDQNRVKFRFETKPFTIKRSVIAEKVLSKEGTENVEEEN